MAGVPSGTSAVNNGEIMKKLLVFLFLLRISLVYCNLVTVAQDSTGDFLDIQAAIIACTNYDTILVYPGIYYENIDYMGKVLVIGSFNMITGEDEFIHSTIIDGNNAGRVVTLMDDEGDGTKIIGFTIKNGYCERGAGIRLSGSCLEVRNCIIESNQATISAGGIYVAYESEIFLSKVTVRYNYSLFSFGGIGTSPDSSIDFDPDNLCSIYANYGPDACDMRIKNDLEDPQYSLFTLIRSVV